MADNRAMEEQMERHNPVNPKNSLSNRREMVMRNVGAGATPSMGLSEFRGGKHTLLDHMKNPTKGYGRKGKMAQQDASEAHQMGLALGKHLHGLHGGSFHKDFSEGVMRGGGIFDSIKNAFDPNKNGVANAFNKVGNEFTNPNSVLRHDVAPKVANEFTDPKSVLRGQVIPYGAKVAQVAQPFLDMGVPGLGTAINTGFKVANYANQGANMLGYGKTGHTEGKGKCGGKKRRSPASAGDGRRKRAEVVKKVMAEKGMKMIEASKYVKEHGLY
jgi:hypothetical protein